MIEWRIPREKKRSDIWYFENALSDEQIHIIETASQHTEEMDGEVGNESPSAFAPDPKFRKSKVKWLSSSLPNMEGIYRTLTDFIISANADNFCKAISGIEILQYTVYDSSYEGFYGKHTDQFDEYNSFGVSRTLSFSIQLSDPSEYDGGDLVLYTNREIYAPRGKGTINFFDSTTVHEVTPVRRGVRKSLVGWVH